MIILFTKTNTGSNHFYVAAVSNISLVIRQQISHDVLVMSAAFSSEKPSVRCEINHDIFLFPQALALCCGAIRSTIYPLIKLMDLRFIQCAIHRTTQCKLVSVLTLRNTPTRCGHTSNDWFHVQKIYHCPPQVSYEIVSLFLLMELYWFYYRMIDSAFSDK